MEHNKAINLYHKPDFSTISRKTTSDNVTRKCRSRSIESHILNKSLTLVKRCFIGYKITSGSMKTDQNLRDEWTVKNVPSCIKGKSGASQILKNLQQRKENAHEFTLNSMATELATIDKACNDEFRKLSEQQKVAINTTYVEIEIVQIKLSEIHVADATEESYTIASKQVEQLAEQHKLLLNDFFDDLQSIEQKRLAYTRSLMGKYSKILLKKYYPFPAEIQSRIEKEILHYNRTVLQNHRTYADLFLQNCLLVDTLRFNMKNWIDALKAEHSEIIRADALKIFEFEKHILTDTEIILLNRKEIAGIISQLGITIEKLNEIMEQWSEALFAENTYLEQFVKIDEIVAAYDKYFKAVIEKCNAILLNIYHCYENQIQTFKSVNENCDYFEQDNLMVNEMLRSIRQKHKEIFIELENVRYDTVQNIQEALLDVRMFFKDFHSLRTIHASKVTDIQNELTTAVENTIIKYEKVHKEFEDRLNVALENARQEYSEINVEKRLTQVYGILRETEEKYCDNSLWVQDFQDKQLQFKKYQDMVDQAIPILLSDIEKFVLVHSRQHMQDTPNNYLKEKNSTTEFENENKLIKQINVHMLHFNELIVNRKAALIQNITSNYPIRFKQFLKSIDLWEKTIFQEHKDKFELKITFIAKQHKDIRSEVYETRRHEIRIHKDRLEEHTMGIYQFVNSVAEELKAFLQEQKEMNKKFQEEFGKNYTELVKAESKTLIQRLIQMKMTTMEQHENLINTNFTEYHNQLINKCVWLRDQTDIFIKSICLFKNGGNFHPDEAKEFHKALSVSIKSVDRVERETTLKINRNLKELLADIDKKRNSAIERTNAMIEDRNFHDTILGTIMKCTNLLEKEISQLFHRVTKLTTDLLGHLEIYRNNAQNNLSIKDLLNNWNELLDEFNENFNILSIPFPSVKETAPVDVRNNLKDYRPDIGDVQAMVKNKKKSKPSTNYIDYRKLIFNTEKSPISEGNFFSINVINNLWNNFTRVQDTAKNYFASMENRNTTQEDVLVSDYNDFMEKVCFRFQSHLSQCQNIWMVKFKEFLELAKLLRKNIHKWILHNFREFDEVNNASIILQKERASVEFDRTMKHFREKRITLADSLKVIHGFPGNKNLLEARNNLIQNEERVMREEVTILYNKFKSEFDETYDICRMSLKQLTCQLTKVWNKLEFVEAALHLQKIIKDNVAMAITKKSLRTSGQSLTVDQGSFRLFKGDYRLNVPNEIKRPNITEWPNQKSSLASRKSIMGNFGKILETRLVPTRKLSVGRPINLTLGIDSVAENYAQKIQEIYIIALEEADAAVKRFHEDGQDFLKMWNCYVSTVTKVYNANPSYNKDVDLSPR